MRKKCKIRSITYICKPKVINFVFFAKRSVLSIANMDAQLYLYSCSLLQHGEFNSSVSSGKAPLNSFKCSFPNDILLLSNLPAACSQ